MTNIREIPLPKARRRDVQDWQIAFWAAKRREEARLKALYGDEQQA